MGGSCHPLTCCDRDCAGANHCQMGGYSCDSCGKYFCGDEIDENGLCPDCAAEAERREAVNCADCKWLGDVVGDRAHCNKYGTDFSPDAFEDDCDGFEEREDA